MSDFSKEQIEQAKEAFAKKETPIPLPKADLNKTPILFVFRHGQSEDNLNYIFSGWRDSKLSEEGYKQAEILAENMRNLKIDLGITSRLQRAKDTLDIVLKYHSNTKVEIDDRVIERSYGDLEGTSKLEMQLEDPELLQNYRRSYKLFAKNGESLQMVEIRITEFMHDLLPRMKKENINVAISCHNNSMRMIRKYMELRSVEDIPHLSNPLGQDFASYSVI